MRLLLKLALAAALTMAAPAASQQARKAEPLRGAKDVAAAPAEPPPAQPLMAPLQSPIPAGPPQSPVQAADQCRAGCAQNYYFCLSSDTPDECPNAWSQCRLSCNAAFGRGGLSAFSRRTISWVTRVTFLNIDLRMPHAARLPLGKREQTKVQNRQAILRAAREVFAELGYETTTVRDIIRRTGLAAGTFYNYYRSKEEVFAALAAEGTKRFAPILKASRADAQDYEGFVRAAITAFFEFLADEHNNWIAGRPPGEAVPQRRETPESAAVFEEVRSAVVEESQRSGLSADPDYLAASCIAIAREIGDQMLLRRPIDIPGAADFAVTMILSGMRGLPKARS